jgi:hypothetical protein
VLVVLGNLTFFVLCSRWFNPKLMFRLFPLVCFAGVWVVWMHVRI